MKTIACNLCGSAEYSKVLSGRDRYLNIDKASFDLVRCKACGLMYLNPQPTLEELSKYYPSDYPPYTNNHAIFEYGPILRTIQGAYHFVHKPTTKKVSAESPAPQDTSRQVILDFGCGNGSVLLALRKEHPHWELYGFDLSTNKEVKKLAGDITIYYDDFSAFENNFAPASLDRIYMNNVLEHVHNPSDILTRLRSLLKPDGEIRIEVPNIDSFKFKLFGKYFSSLDIPRHLYHFSPKTLRAICEKNGLTVTSLSFAGTTKSSTMSLYYALGISKRKFNPITYRILDEIARVLGRKRVDDDSMIAVAVKKS